MKKTLAQLWILTWLWIGLAAGLQAADAGYKGFPRGDVLITAQELNTLMDTQRAWDAALAEGKTPTG